MPNMKDLSLRVKKLWPMFKFFDGQTDGRTDRVITIGHPSSGGSLKIYFCGTYQKSERQLFL